MRSTISTENQTTIADAVIADASITRETQALHQAVLTTAS